MATLPKEQVIQRNRTGDVSIVSGYQEDAPGEKLWLSTTTEPYTVVDTKSVITSAGNTNQQDGQTVIDRVNDAGADQYGDLNIYEGGHGGYQHQQLIKLGDTTLSVGNNATASKDIAPFVAGSGDLSYSIDSEATIDNGTAEMSGSVLSYTAGGTDGTDTVPVIVSDAGDTVTVNVVVTVA